jgi:hypothetical protein
VAASIRIREVVGAFGANSAGMFIGAESRYLRNYDGLGLDSFRGNALYLARPLREISQRLWLSAAWNIQVAGHAANDGRSLDLTNFERNQVEFQFGYNF